MKRLMAIGALLVAPLGCVSNQGDAFIRFLENRDSTFEGGVCNTEAGTFRKRGFLDVTGGGNYQLALSVETNTFAQEISVGQDIFSGEGLSDITLTDIVYTYEFSGPSNGLSLPAEEVVPIYAVFRPETDPEQSFIFLDALGPGALKAVQDFYVNGVAPADRPDRPETTILSFIKGRGYLSGSQRTETNIFRFPTTLFASNFTACPPGQVLLQRCGSVGQDGRVLCVDGS